MLKLHASSCNTAIVVETFSKFEIFETHGMKSLQQQHSHNDNKTGDLILCHVDYSLLVPY
jgi:hypothetical protein